MDVTDSSVDVLFVGASPLELALAYQFTANSVFLCKT